MVVEVGDGNGNADGGPEVLSSSVGMTGHVVPLQLCAVLGFAVKYKVRIPKNPV